MAEIQGNIPASVAVPQFDALGTISKAQGLGAQMLQNRLLGQQVDSRIALGQAVTSATDPTTGQTDWRKALGALSQDPKGSFAVPELAGQVLDRQVKELQLGKEDLDLAAKRWTKIGDTAGALLSQKDPLTREQVIKDLADNLVGSGMFHDEKSVLGLTNFVQNLPNDDQGLRKALGQAYLSSGMSLERINSMLGAPAQVDTGSQIINQQTSPLTGEVQANAVIDKTRSPTEKSAMVQVWDPGKQAYVLKPSGAIVGDLAPGALPSPSATVQAAPGLGEPEAAAGAVQQAQGLRTAAEKTPETAAALMNIRDQMGKFQPGPKANWTYLLGALSQQLGVAPPKVTEGVAAQEEFNKLATQFINSQVGALGGTGTDAKLESARHGSPNEFMSKEGIMNVTNLMLGLNDAVKAKNEAWQKWLDAGNTPATYGKFQTQFNQIYNPRVFQSVYMNDAQRQTMMKNMAPKEREQFEKDWVRARKAGWIQ